MADDKVITVSELLLEENRYRILRALSDNDEGNSISEIASKSGCSRQFVSAYLDRLSRAGLVKKEMRGNMCIVSINRASPYYSPIKDLMEIDSKPLETIARNYGEKAVRHEEVESVVLFGSLARGNPTIDSDIDILVILSDNSEEVKEDLRAEKESLNKEKDVRLSITFYEKQEFLKDLKASRKFVENVVNDGKVLAGEKFWEK